VRQVGTRPFAKLAPSIWMRDRGTRAAAAATAASQSIKAVRSRRPNHRGSARVHRPSGGGAPKDTSGSSLRNLCLAGAACDLHNFIGVIIINTFVQASPFLMLGQSDAKWTSSTHSFMAVLCNLILLCYYFFGAGICIHREQ
jgi:hypothetical protein